MALSPWPNAGTQARTNAIATLRPLLSTSLPLKKPDGTPDADGETRLETRLNQVGMTAAAMVEREAPSAPQAAKDEAVIRFAGYLFSARWGELEKSSLGPRDRNFVTNHAPMFRNCGAKGLLAPWKVRRAGAIG